MKKSTILKSLRLKSDISTTSLLKKTMQVTAFTFSCLVVLPSFGQPGCDWDPFTGTLTCPTGGGGSCGWLCDDESGEDGDGGGNSGPSAAEKQQCLDLYQQKPTTCLTDPISSVAYNWNPYGTEFYNNRNAFSAIKSPGWPHGNVGVSFYQDIIRSVAQNYWSTQTESSINSAYWEIMWDYCTNNFVADGGFFVYDRSDCFYSAYRTSMQLLPAWSDSAYTLSQIEGYGITVEHHTNGDPLGNWAVSFYTDVNEVKECKVWFDVKDTINGCE